MRINGDWVYNARLMIRGCEQRTSAQYNVTFSPVMDTNAFRTLSAVTTNPRYGMITLDVKTAFLHCELEEDI